LLDASSFRSIASGERRGPGALTLRAILRTVETPYAWAVKRRNRKYDGDVSENDRVHRVDAPVVSIGNLTLGGTGKTPLVAWIVNRLQSQGRTPGIVSRGYGTKQGVANDEALELARLTNEAPHVQDPDRVAAARRAISEHGCEFIVADDAFQHRRLHRDLDVVLLDAIEPFGYEHVFPRGLLREPAESLRRADVVLLSRADLATPARRAAVRARVALLAPSTAWGEIAHVPTSLIGLDGTERPIDELGDQPIVAFCGLGNPTGFRQTLARCNADVQTFIEFPDHYAYRESDYRRIADAARASNASMIVCTMKDLVKIDVPAFTAAELDIPLFALGIGIEFLEGEEMFLQRLDELTII